MAAGGMNADGFIRCCKALHLVVHQSIRCVDDVLKAWHARQCQALPSCSRPRPRPPSNPQECKDSGKPKSSSSCSNCVAWGKAVEDVYYPQMAKGSMPWGNVSPLRLPRSPVEVAKAFVLRLQRGKRYITMEHFDSASVLMIMMHFDIFHGRDQNKFDIIKKVSDARNKLCHMQLEDNLYLDDQQVDDIFSDIADLIACLETLHPRSFTLQHALDIRIQLSQIKTGPVTAEMKKVLKYFTKSVEEVANQTVKKVQTAIKETGHLIMNTVHVEHQTTQDVQAALSQELTHQVDEIPIATCKQLDPKLEQLSRDIQQTFLDEHTDLSQEQRVLSQALKQDIHKVPVAVQEELRPIFEQVHQAIQEEHCILGRDLGLKQEELSQDVRGVKETIQADLYKRQPVFDVNQCRHNLMAEYQQTRSKLTLLPGMPDECADMDDLYIELDLLEEEKTPTEVKIKRTLKSADELFSLQNKRGKYCKRILVRGGPGSGKSCTVSKLAYDWAHEKVIPGLPYEIDLLFALDLREIQKGMNLIDAIQDQLLPKYSKDMLISYIESHAKSVVFLLDGFDEAPDVPQHGDIKYLLSSKWLQESLVIVTTRPPDMAKFVNTYGVYSHIQLTGFSMEHIKEYVLRFIQFHSYSHSIEVSGTCYYTYPPTDVKEVRDVVSFLNCLVISFKGLCHTPLTLSMLCLMWSENKETLPKKITEIYGRTFLHLRDHKQSKFDKLDIKYLWQLLNKTVLEIGGTALNALFQDRLVFQTDEFDGHTLDHAFNFGLLSMEKKRSKCSTIDHISFYHKTFQEYCAAKYWTSLLEKDKQMFMSYLQKINADNVNNLKILLQFCCGLCCETAEIILPHIVGLTCNKLSYFSETGFETFTHTNWDIPLALLYETGTKQLHTHLLPLYDLQSSQSWNVDIPRQSAETNSFLDSVVHRTESINYIFKDATELHITLDNSSANHQRYLKILACASKLQSLIIRFKYMKDLNQFQNAFIAYDIPCRKLISKVTYYPKSVEEIDAPTCEDYPVVSIVNHLISLGTLHFIDIKMVDIVHLLQSPVKPIEELIIQGVGEFTELFIEALYSLIPSLQRLSISNSISKNNSDSHCKELSTVFIKVGTGLRSNKAGANTLAEGFQGEVQDDEQSVHLPCKELVLTYGPISVDAALKLVQAFNYLGNLQVLRLHCAQITNNIGAIIGQHLGKLSHLEILDLGINDIGANGGSQIGTNLCHLSELQTLDLSHNPIGAIYDGSQIGRYLLHVLRTGLTKYNPDHMFHGMKSLTKLKRLLLANTQLNERNISQLGVSLTHMPDLQELDLHQNHVGIAAKDLCNGLEHLANLDKLNLGNTGLNKDGIVCLASSLIHMPDLKYLDLDENNIGSAMGDLCDGGLEHLANLDKLNLGNTGLNKDGIVCLASSLIHMPDLKYLDLDENNIGSAMGDLCDGLRHMTKLQKLTLRNTAITDDGISMLPLAHLTELRELLLDGRNQLYGPQGVEHLFRNLHHVRHLHWLSVNYSTGWLEKNAFLKECNQVCSLHVSDDECWFTSRRHILALMRFVETYNSEHYSV